ncbi:hypothetical protein, partial [Kineococcus indalonis]|uniref:hypothetical protein n=1 Tax=Kineococcus indalonis TaxID=2696566 RepID=UPI001411CD95
MLDVPVVIPLTLLALGVGALGCLVRPRWDVAVLTGLLCAVWTRVNGPVEGRILHSWSADRGFTEADLLAVAGLLVVGTALLRCAVRDARSLAGGRHRRRGAAGPVRPSSPGAGPGAGHQ